MKIFRCLLLVLLLLPACALAANTRKEVTLDIAPLYQDDYTTVLFTYKKEEKSVQSSGCGAVCLSMVMSYLDENVEQDPESLMMWAFFHDYYKGTGLSCKTMMQILEDYGFCGKWIPKEPLLPIRKALEAGHPVIAYVGEGYFSSAGHYILIYGIDPTGAFSGDRPQQRGTILKSVSLGIYHPADRKQLCVSDLLACGGGIAIVGTQSAKTRDLSSNKTQKGVCLMRTSQRFFSKPSGTKDLDKRGTPCMRQTAKRFFTAD